MGLIPKSGGGSGTPFDLTAHNLDPTAHPPLNTRITQLENDIKYRLILTEAQFSLPRNGVISMPIDPLNDKHFEVLRQIPTLDPTVTASDLILTVTNPNNRPLTDFQISINLSRYIPMFSERYFYVRDTQTGQFIAWTLENNTNQELTNDIFNSNGIMWIKIPNIDAGETKRYRISNVAGYSFIDDVFDFYDSFPYFRPSWWQPIGTVGTYNVVNGELQMYGNWGGCCNGFCIYSHLRTTTIFTKPIVVESSFRITRPSIQLSRSFYICYQVNFNNYDAMGISHNTAGYHFRSGTTYVTRTYNYPPDTNFHLIQMYFYNDKMRLVTDYGIDETWYGVVPTSPDTGYIGIAGDTDITTGYDVLDWIRVRKVAEQDLIRKLELYAYFNTRYWIRIVDMNFTLLPPTPAGQEQIIFIVDGVEYYFDTNFNRWREVTKPSNFNTIAELNALTSADWAGFPLGDTLKILNKRAGEFTVTITKIGDFAYEDYPFYVIQGNNLYVRNIYDFPIEVVIRTFKTTLP